jgi:hypothetical protein
MTGDLSPSPRAITGDALISMMRTHTIVIVGGVQRNPVFVPLGRLLTAMAELRDWLAPARPPSGVT